jgi:hypothetical protein
LHVIEVSLHDRDKTINDSSSDRVIKEYLRVDPASLNENLAQGLISQEVRKAADKAVVVDFSLLCCVSNPIELAQRN